MQPWKHVKEPEIVKVGWRTLTRKTFLQPDGKEAEYVTVGDLAPRHGAVIALTKDNQVIIAEQFRPGPEQIYQELPGGNIENGEDPEEGVMRELLEETGYASDTVEFLGEARKDAYMNATWYFYLALNVQKVSDQRLDSGEFVHVREISIEQLIQNARESKMSDAQAVFLAYERLKSITKEGLQVT